VLKAYPWPGNVRELRHVLERSVIGNTTGTIEVDELPLEKQHDLDSAFGVAGMNRPTLEEVERRYLEMVLRDVKGNQTEAAAILGISRKALWEKRKRYRME
jgi:DNA-binding NtrC family response regulator